MSFKFSSRSGSSCRALNKAAVALSGRSISWATRVPFRPPTWLQIRGAKSRTVIKASSLPQGALPPLPPSDGNGTVTKNYPPLLQEHLNNIRKYRDCVILTRVGDFYEMYFEQAEQYAPLVNLKKARRITNLGDVAMAGFQYAQLDRYLKMFVQDLGKNVAISEQKRLPDSERSSRGGNALYERRVTRIITPGTLIDENFVDSSENNYLLAVHLGASLPSSSLQADEVASIQSTRDVPVGLSWVDLASGSFFTQSSNLASLSSVVARVGPREIVLDLSLETMEQEALPKMLGEGRYSIHFHGAQNTRSSISEWTPMLETAVPEEIAGLFTQDEVAAGSLILDYVRDKLPGANLQLQPPIRQADDEYMSIDKQSLRGLEIRSTIRDGNFQGSLLHAMRRTTTKSGARLLSRRLVSPSMSLAVINDRLDLVEEMINHEALREDVVALLRRTSDTLRLLQRFSIGKGDADDLLGLAKTVDVMSELSTILQSHIDRDTRYERPESTVDREGGRLQDILGRFYLDGPVKLAKDIQAAIDEEGLDRKHVAESEARSEAEDAAQEAISADMLDDVDVKPVRRSSKRTPAAAASEAGEIWIMRRNASKTLEAAHRDLEMLLDAKNELTHSLRKQMRIESLTLKWTALLGHHCHVKGKDARGAIDSLPGTRSIGSTKSSRTFYLTDWTHLGIRIDDNKLRIRIEEERVFGKLRGHVIDNLMKLRRNAAVLDELDVASSSAVLAKERNLVRPSINNGTSHHVLGARHPTVDVGLRHQGRLFTPNDCMVGDQEKIYLITGPNMAGKSTYLRQNALITILAQTGCFVPAEYAAIGLVDKIFSRVGSADNLYQDQSTFMVEMLETAEILKQATPRSFVIMDEIGRGTTPEDGVAVGYACLHHLHYVNRSRALFATHFHALADMTRDFKALACYCTDVAEEHDGSWAYVHKLRRGVNRDSHALKVARLAGLPDSAIRVASQVLTSLQESHGPVRSREAAPVAKTAVAGS